MMSALAERWRVLQPREQWLALLVLSTLLLVLWVDVGRSWLVGQRQQQDAERQQLQARSQQARLELLELQARAINRPEQALQSTLGQSQQALQQLRAQLAEDTRALVTPLQMQTLLQQLLQQRTGLRLSALESFSERMEAPLLEGARDALQGRAPQALFRHGLRLQLEGNYFALRDYLRAVEQAAPALLWQTLDYRVGEQGPGQAQIELEVFTLGSAEGLIGV